PGSARGGLRGAGGCALRRHPHRRRPAAVPRCDGVVAVRDWLRLRAAAAARRRPGLPRAAPDGRSPRRGGRYGLSVSSAIYPLVFRHALSLLDAEQAHRLTMTALRTAQRLPGAPDLMQAVFRTTDPSLNPHLARTPLGLPQR